VHRLLPALTALVALALSLSLSSCVRRFEEPAPNEPHALVKVRIVHHASPGPDLSERVRWNDYAVAVPAPSATHAGPMRESIRAVRVRPELAQWRIDTRYSHTVVTQRMETRYRSEQYACGTETTGYGQTTSTRTRYCSRQVPYQELVTHHDTVVDGSCTNGAIHTPLAGAVYVLQYDYFGEDRCTMQCLRQLPATDGSFRFIPCGAGEPPPDAMVVTAGGDAPLPPVQVIQAR
jgi:hypothetical protein